MHRRMFRYRLYPSKTQIMVLNEQLELCRIIYNQLFDNCKQQYKEKGKTPSQFDLNNLLILLKQVRPEISRIHSQILQNARARIPPESRPAEEETTTPPLEAVQVYPVKQEASLLVGR